MREVFINARKDVDWVNELVPVKGARSLLIVDDPATALIIRTYDRVEPVFLNQPNQEFKLTGSAANQVSSLLRQRFPPR